MQSVMDGIPLKSLRMAENKLESFVVAKVVYFFCIQIKKPRLVQMFSPNVAKFSAIYVIVKIEIKNSTTK